jgi:zinc/manganese transport system substrate-binding protein
MLKCTHRFGVWVVLILLGGSAFAAPLKIASLHPIVSDLARQIGGDQVTVIDLMPLDSNPHTYYPTPANLKAASDADLVLAAGKGLETYLDEFRESLGGRIPLYEVGRAVPSLRVEADEVFICCPAHASGAIDPHWWHSIKNTRRAAGALADELSRLRPESAAYFQQRFTSYAATLDELYAWAKKEIARIPRADRELTTAHAAFGYLCREMGLRSITVLGLTTVHDADPGYMKDVIRTLREHHVRAVFPEVNANPNVLESMARETGVAIGDHLYADMVGLDDTSYTAMMRHNIRAITTSLTNGK